MRNVYIFFAPNGNIKIRRLVMPMGLLIAAGAVRKSPLFGKDDRLYICDTFREVLRKAELHKNDRIHFLVSSVGVIRAIKRSADPAVDCLKNLKRRYPNIVSCVGGPDIYFGPEDYQSHFDVVFQGEIGAVDLIEVIRSGVPFFQAPPADMDAEPLDYGLLAGKKYLAASLQTTRGCPFDCAFCNVGRLFGRGIRSIDPGNLEARLESLAKVHKGFVIIADDSF
ncbi:MAG: radical SAM protein, partial [Candidatus Aminicenantales bacterium]